MAIFTNKAGKNRVWLIIIAAFILMVVAVVVASLFLKQKQFDATTGKPTDSNNYTRNVLSGIKKKKS
jgi:flagellar basal body-associated protein FliL